MIFHRHAVNALQPCPTHGTVDAACDAWSVSDAATLRSSSPHAPHGLPFCATGVLLHPTVPDDHPSDSCTRRCGCPLATGDPCDQDHGGTDNGCVATVIQELGSLQHSTLDCRRPVSRTPPGVPPATASPARPPLRAWNARKVAMVARDPDVCASSWACRDACIIDHHRTPPLT
jgi:hypothetical protein